MHPIAHPSRVPCLILPALVIGVGCVDPEGRLDDFAERVGPFEGGLPIDGSFDGGGPCTVLPGQVEGSYLLTLSVALQPGTPIVTLLDLSTPPANGGAGIQFEGQALSASDRTTPVGDPISAGPIPIQPDGTFSIELPGLTVPGEANPISGAPITADVTLIGSLCGEGDFFCGIAQGTVTAPLMLELAGSTFTLTRVDEGAGPPTQPPIDCAGNLADPI